MCRVSATREGGRSMRAESSLIKVDLSEFDIESGSALHSV